MSLQGRALGIPRTRAERIRARRARHGSIVEPVSGRRGSQRGQRRAPRRRHYLALPGTSGAAVRLPAMPAIKLPARMLSTLLLAATIWCLQLVLRSPDYVVRDIAVSGANLLSEAQIRSIAQVNGKSVFLIDPDQAIERLSRHPEVASAELTLHWPNQAVIEIVEREPVISWNDAGMTWWLSSDGVAFMQRGEWPGLLRVVASQPVLQIENKAQTAAIAPHMVKAVVELGARLPSGAEISFDPAHGLSFIDQHGWQVLFGTQGDVGSKIRLYEAIAEALESHGAQVLLISVENQGAPFYRLAR